MADDLQRRGVCVVTVRCTAGAPPRITVSVRLDVDDPGSETRREAGTNRQIVAQVSEFLRKLGVPE
ncbi:hypothetical protein [Paractinoplanes maris]|uniref:hypothetical protein n=1 Tax=Paractinoplanes maris TaxID=1734446 RepID=UPI00202139B9|nr:hypothetical protein [Actinoplanes maris]